ncbi:CHAT domain-containing protein [Hypoxylon crocopeplum]|nr:CHAT domain-containing protein [Hypoxylon crocopeplum]
MVSLLGQLNNNELCSFSIEYDEPGDAAIELKIYAFFLIFTRTLSPEHLNEAIQCANRWNESLGIDNPDRLRRCQIVDEMITLRTHFRDFQEQYRALFSRNDRFKQTKSIDDLDRAVEVAETYSNAPDNSNRADCFFMLSILLGKRFKITGLPHDLNRAIKAGDNVIENMRQDHPQRHVYLNDIGCRLAERFQLSAGLQLEDFNRAVDMLNTAIDATPDDDPHRATYFNNLGGLFGTWCSRGGTIDDLNRAIDMANVAIDDTSRSPTVRASYFSNLSALLRRRSHMTGSTEDLDRAVELAEMAVAVTPECHPNKAIVLSILGNAFERRFRRAGSIGDLDSSVDAAIRALDAIPEKYPTRTDFLSCFGLRLAMRFERSGAIDDSDLSIAVLDTAVASMPEDYVAKAGCFQNFAHSLHRALEFAEMAIDATPQGDRNRESQFGIRGSLLEMRYQRTGSPEDLDAALSLYKEGWNSHIAPPFRRIYQADRAAAILASQSNWKESSQLLKEALDLLPALSPRSLKHTDKQHMLERSAGLASVAAATYLNAEGVESEEIAYNALRFLELGRGIIAGLLMDMRVDVSDLKRKYPLLADEFESLRDQLDSPIDEDTYRSFDEVSSSWESRVKRRREAEDKFNQVLKTIRTKPEFCNFLLPPTRDELMAAADPDPIVVINLSSYRCDALLVQHNQIRMLKLPRLTLAEARKWARDLRLAHQADITPMLEYLWNAVCRPCLDTLGFRTERDSSDNRRVWWIPTGVLSQLPLHAAGLYSPGSKDTVLDRVMSSYASSIKALIRGRPQCSKSLAPSPTARALLIAMETTPGKGALEFAEREVAMLSQLCPDLKLQPIRPAPRKADVLEHLDNCNIFHFAGHGMSDPQEPSRSTLLLDDWQTNSLTVGDLRDYKVQENRPFLGYLSACSTGSNQIEGLVDEAVHLIGALQLAGFRHVVGTLWEVSDSHCVEVTKVLYETLRSEGLTDIAVCRGLHLAVKKLRDEAVEREGWWRDAEGVDRERSCYWVPYVHFGV